MAMLSFEEFQATAQKMTVAEAAEFFSDYEETFGGDGSAAVHVYAGQCFIVEATDGAFWTVIERDDKRGERADVERFLFDEWYVWEGAE